MNMPENEWLNVEIEDVASIRKAAKTLDKGLDRVKVLLKGLCVSLKDVSKAFNELTSLSFSDPTLSNYVRGVDAEITRLRSGEPLYYYYSCFNKSVHEELGRLTKTYHDTQSSIDKCEKARHEYMTAMKNLSKKEERCKQKNKPLFKSSEYASLKSRSEKCLLLYQKRRRELQMFFSVLQRQVGVVTTDVMKRFMGLSAGFLTIVIDAITQMNPDVYEVMDRYRGHVGANNTTRTSNNTLNAADPPYAAPSIQSSAFLRNPEQPVGQASGPWQPQPPHVPPTFFASHPVEGVPLAARIGVRG